MMAWRSRPNLFFLAFAFCLPTNCQTPPSGNSSSNLKASGGCSGCFLKAATAYFVYPGPVSTTTIPFNVTRVPYVTIHDNGSKETTYKTLIVENGTTVQFSETPTYDNSPVTWTVVSGFTGTYPTTYFSLYGPVGGLVTRSNGGCTPNVETLPVPTNHPESLVLPLKKDQSPLSAPPEILSYYDKAPAIASMFNGTHLRDCSYTTYTVQFDIEGTLPVVKVSVASLTVVSGKEVLLPGLNQNVQGPAGKTTAAAYSTPAAQANSLAPTSIPVPEKSVQPAPISYTPSPLASHTTIPVGSTTPHPGSTAGSPVTYSAPSIVITISGSTIPIAPTIIPGSAGPSTAYILGPGTTLAPGGSAVTLAGGGTISLPSNYFSSGTTSSGLGGVIVSGLGYTGPQYTGIGIRTHSNPSLWVLSMICGLVVLVAV